MMMSSKRIWKILLNFSTLLLLPITFVLGQFLTIVEYKSYRHEYRDAFYKVNTLALLRYGNHKFFNGCLVFAQDIHEFDVKVLITVPKGESGRWTLLNISLDGCKLLGSDFKQSQKIMHLVVGRIKENMPRFPTGCPIKKDIEFCFKNYSPNAVRLPSNLLARKIYFLFEMFQKEVLVYKGFYEMALKGKQ